MAIVEGKVNITKEQLQRDEKGKRVTVQAKVFTRVYDCRPQVIERKRWKKFGEVASVPRGQHLRGDFTQADVVKIKTHEGEVQEEIELVKQFQNITKVSRN